MERKKAVEFLTGIIVIVGVPLLLLFVIVWVFFPPQFPPSPDVHKIARETLQDAYRVQGVLKSSSKVSIKPNEILATREIAISDLGISYTQVCLGVSKNLKDLFEFSEPSRLVYKSSNVRDIHIVAVCVQSDNLQKFVADVFYSDNVMDIRCPPEFKKTGNEIGCFVGVKPA